MNLTLRKTAQKKRIKKKNNGFEFRDHKKGSRIRQCSINIADQIRLEIQRPQE